MKIIIVNGSPKKAGITYHGLMKMEALLNAMPEVVVEIIQLSEYEMQFCTGCTTCYAKGYCPKDEQDGFLQVRKKIEEADGIIFGSPNYASQVTGLFKNFIDRMDFVTGQAMQGKYVLILATYQNVRGKKVAAYMKEQVIFAGGKVTGTLAIQKNPYIRPIEFSDEMGKIEKEVNRFYRSILEKHGKNLKEIFINRVVIRSIKGFALGDYAKAYAGLIGSLTKKGLM